LGPHPGPAFFCADLRIALPAADPRRRGCAHKPRQRAHRPDGEHLFSRAVFRVAEQH
jgi:hypothetical protein